MKQTAQDQRSDGGTSVHIRRRKRTRPHTPTLPTPPEYIPSEIETKKSPWQQRRRRRPAVAPFPQKDDDVITDFPLPFPLDRRSWGFGGLGCCGWCDIWHPSSSLFPPFCSTPLPSPHINSTLGSCLSILHPRFPLHVCPPCHIVCI